jgi:hypothetical protein
MQKSILVADAAINLVLGVMLLIFSEGLIRFLGVPSSDTAFYPNILGAIFIGIGIALIIEAVGKTGGPTGLGLTGAVCINLCGGLVLAVWLVWGDLSLPLRGYVLLWTLTGILVGLSSLELLVQKCVKKGGRS